MSLECKDCSKDMQQSAADPGFGKMGCESCSLPPPTTTSEDSLRQKSLWTLLKKSLKQVRKPFLPLCAQRHLSSFACCWCFPLFEGKETSKPLQPDCGEAELSLEQWQVQWQWAGERGVPPPFSCSQETGQGEEPTILPIAASIVEPNSHAAWLEWVGVVLKLPPCSGHWGKEQQVRDGKGGAFELGGGRQSFLTCFGSFKKSPEALMMGSNPKVECIYATVPPLYLPWQVSLLFLITALV